MDKRLIFKQNNENNELLSYICTTQNKCTVGGAGAGCVGGGGSIAPPLDANLLGIA